MRRRWRSRSCWLMLVSVVVTGCQQTADAPENQSPSYAGITLRVGAIDDVPILAGVAPQCGEWKASRRGDVLIRDEPIALQSVTEVDILLFPADRLGSLVDAGVLAKIPNEAVFPPKPAETEAGDERRRAQDEKNSPVVDVFQCMDIAPAYREQVSRYGPDRLALPCGGSALSSRFAAMRSSVRPIKRRPNRRGLPSSRRRPGNNLIRSQNSSTAATGAATVNPI